MALSRSLVTKQALAPEFSRMYANSFACSLAFIGTATRPACQQAKSTSWYSTQFFMARPTRSPGWRPSLPKSEARRATRSASCPYDSTGRLPSAMARESGASRALRASRCARFTEAEERLGVAGGFLGELLERLANGARHGLGDVGEECRLVASRFRLRPHVARREIGRVGLEEQPIGGNVAHQLEQVRAAAL